MATSPWVLAVIGLSWAVSVFLCFRLWRSQDYLFFKLALGLILFVPVAGPLFYGWVQNFPDSQPEDLQDQARYSADVHHRWRDRLEERGWLPPLERWDKRKKGR